MQENHTLEGSAVLVTGAGSGLGEATARAFAAAGCVVSCVDINQAELERVCQELKSVGAASQALLCDIRDAEAIAQVTQKAVEWAGRLDILVNCAAIDYTCSVEEMSVEQWDQELAVNLRGPFLFARAAFPWMKNREAAISSISPPPRPCAHGATPLPITPPSGESLALAAV